MYLAEQDDLAGRPVVLKISAIEGTEPQTLAQLQHTNIVPIYSVHEDARAGLRAVCMPYFGGDSLSSLLEHLWRGDHRPVHGSEVVAALKEVQAPTPEALKGHGEDCKAAPACSPDAEARTPLALSREFSYVQTSAWIVAQLAEGLHHAHQRGILHRDIKPSNVLISAEGQPLLLDFNLAYERDGDPAQATLGGTVAYMAPEHLLAMVGRSPALTRQVDERSDLYSLGMILGELLTGHRLFDHSGSYSVVPLEIEAMALERSKAAPSMRSQRPDIPWSLESIARKCLAPDPSRRYQQADHLAEDLRRFLTDCPLKYAPELSRVERVRKYFRRHPRLTSSGSVATAALVVLLAVGTSLAAARGHLSEARARLGTVQARDRQKAHEDGMVKALCLVNTSLDLQDHLREGADVCEKTLALYDVPGGAPGGEHPDWAGLDPGTRRRLAEDRRELFTLLAGARVRLAPGDRSVLRQALALLDRAEAIRGLAPSRALWLDRAHYLGQLGELEGAKAALREADQLPVTTARDHYQLATVYARRGGAEGFARAVAELDEAIRLDPRHYWSLVQRGICHLELGESIPAALDFGRCTGLWPEFAWGYFNRGYVLDRSGRKAEAVEDYTAALERDPRLVPARVNRGLARLELKRYAAALSDFDEALAAGGINAVALRRQGHRPGGDGPPRRGGRGLRRGLRPRPSTPRPRPRPPLLDVWLRGRRPAAGEGACGLRRGAAPGPEARAGPLRVAPCWPPRRGASRRPSGSSTAPSTRRRAMPSPGALVPCSWPGRGNGRVPPGTSTGAWRGTPTRETPTTRPPASPPWRRWHSPTPRSSTRRWTSCSGRSPAAWTSRGSRPIPTWPRSDRIPGSRNGSHGRGDPGAIRLSPTCRVHLSPPPPFPRSNDHDGVY